jgi:WD40 repeat protein
MKGGWEPKICPLQSVISVGVLDNSVVTGTFKGQLILWRGNRTTQTFDAHKGPVMAIHTRKKEIGIITGGKDATVVFWDGSLKMR